MAAKNFRLSTTSAGRRPLRSNSMWKFEVSLRSPLSLANISMAKSASLQGLVFNRLFSSVEQSNDWQHRCFGLYNGIDGIKPPDPVALAGVGGCGCGDQDLRALITSWVRDCLSCAASKACLRPPDARQGQRRPGPEIMGQAQE